MRSLSTRREPQVSADWVGPSSQRTTLISKPGCVRICENQRMQRVRSEPPTAAQNESSTPRKKDLNKQTWSKRREKRQKGSRRSVRQNLYFCGFIIPNNKKKNTKGRMFTLAQMHRRFRMHIQSVLCFFILLKSHSPERTLYTHTHAQSCFEILHLSKRNVFFSWLRMTSPQRWLV